MPIIIMRHGDAIIKAVNDIERSITDRGRDQSRLIARYLSDRVINIELVLVSPYLRARQTLDVLREHLVLPLAQEEVMQELIPSGNAQLICSYLKALHKKGVSNVLVISHLPLVSYLVSYLCPTEYPLILATSAVACIELDTITNSGTMSWQMQPAS
ncbi:phosphohistidine phosphatase SixA [Candidatus Palibaumannia cicadellinicola]|uniref:Phosphohistidine phosphatase SixA n=1 Tax=Candidatus Palibaumannia cicadellinicola TaxID=186490 RepID=A0A088N1T9_9GAMM|nr:phosphohistidine phosphatase SixA [Candidatus Baumannia cicadellinicola]AIN47276.1 Phosphohistidine phosphatase SixA [Candidatus Baumannia cicadellinicola]